jgi:hypothetical protein
MATMRHPKRPLPADPAPDARKRCWEMDVMIAASLACIVAGLLIGTVGDIAGFQPASIDICLALVVASAALYVAGGAPAASRGK